MDDPQAAWLPCPYAHAGPHNPQNCIPSPVSTPDTPQVRYIAAAVDDECLVTSGYARLHTTPADARGELDDLGDGYDWRVFEVREPSVATPDTRDVEADLTARLAAADLGWSRETGDPAAEPDYIRALARQVAAFAPSYLRPATATPSPVATPDTREAVSAEAIICAGVIVGVGGESDPCVTQAQADRATRLIVRELNKHGLLRPAVATPDTQDVEQLRRDLEQAIYDRDRARKDCRRTRVALLPLLPELAVQNAKATLRAGYVAEEAAQELRWMRKPSVATDEQAVQRAKQAIRATREWQAGVAFGVPDTGMDQHAEALARAALNAATSGETR